MPVQYKALHKKREGINDVIDVRVFAMASQKAEKFTAGGEGGTLCLLFGACLLGAPTTQACACTIKSFTLLESLLVKRRETMIFRWQSMK